MPARSRWSAATATTGATTGGNGSETRTIGPNTLEVAILDANRPRRAFRRITGPVLEAMLPEDAATPAE